MKILFGIPTTGMIPFGTSYYLVEAAKHIQRSGHEVFVNFSKNCSIAFNRNSLVKYALDQGFDKLMFIDPDTISVDPRDVLKLCKSGKDIIAGIYPRRELPIKPLTYKLKKGKTKDTDKSMGEGNKIIYVEELTKEDCERTEPFKVAVTGTGFMCINLEIFKRIPMPWFAEIHKRPEKGFVSDDFYFCYNARQNAGIDIWVDPTIRCRHYGIFGYEMAMMITDDEMEKAVDDKSKFKEAK